MADTFNDGDPIDAAALQNLLTRLSAVEALAGSKTSAGSTINLENKTGDIVIPKFYGGVTEKLPLTAGEYVPFTINYSEAEFTKKPFITITPYLAGITKNVSLIYAPQIISITSTSANCRVRVPSGTTAGTARFHFIAIQN